MKNVLMLAHDDGGQEARLQAALDLTRALDGHLHCIDAVDMPVLVDDFGGASTAVLLTEARQCEAENVERLRQRLAGEGVSWSVGEATGDLATCVVEAARTADVVVLNRKLDSPGPDMRHVVGEVLAHGRALVLAVDDDVRRFDACGKVLIGWDGSEGIMHTVKRAVPLLRLAAEVKLLQVGTLSASVIPVEEAAAYLSRHGIAAEIERTAAAPSIAAELRLAADQWGAAWMLLGAFGHGRLREALFGGVTRAMLSACNLPVLMGR